jgi:hypothetical protein
VRNELIWESICDSVYRLRAVFEKEWSVKNSHEKSVVQVAFWDGGVFLMVDI